MSSAFPKVGDNRIADNARFVLHQEAKAVEFLSKNLPEDFIPAVEHVLQSKGRVIVSGVGKSGHIGRKIAATLASTGTPSYFVHSAEASHGDLGMVMENDVLLLISNSGETTELHDTIYYAKRFAIPLIGISSDPQSTLMKAASFKLTLPKLAEACSIGMAPTTSTTLTLALGDAFAVALTAERGFMQEDFGKFHPGGKLGAQMKTVADLMHTDKEMPLMSEDASMQDVLLAMTSKGFGMAGFVRDGALVGVITDGDLRRNMDNLMQAVPMQIANTTPVTVSPDCLAPVALARANERKISALFVVDDASVPVGVIHIHDFLRAGVL